MLPAGVLATELKNILVIYHTLTGGTLQMAQATVRGAGREPSVRTILQPAAQVTVAQVLEADGYVFATPENLGTMSGILKDFFDRTYYAALDQLNGRPYATLICAGSDGQGAARQLERIANGWRLRQIAPALIVLTHAQAPAAILSPKSLQSDDLTRCEEMGQAFATGLSLSVF